MEGSLRHIALTDLGDSVGTPPSQRLRDSVKRMGVVQPIILTSITDTTGEITLRIVDGNRRVAAARAAEMTHVPAVVFDNLEPTAIAEATLTTNGFRSANYLAEFWALKQLERSNYPYEDLLLTSGMSWSTIKNRKELSHLNRELFVALRNSQIAQTDALAAAKLSQNQQEELARKFRRFGKLTRKDIRSVTPSADTKPAVGDTVAQKLSLAAKEASKLGYGKDEFLDMASRMWDESISSHEDDGPTSPASPIQNAADRFPDLAAHKWDTGES